MKLLKGLKICFAVLFLTLPLSGFGQFKFEIQPFFSYFRDLGRYEIGVNGTFAQGTFDGVVRETGYSGQYLGDKTTKRNISAIPGFGGDLGIAIPFAATGHISIWAFSMHLMLNEYAFNDLNKTHDIDSGYKAFPKPLNASVLQVGVPVGIDWKVGCDAICSKRLVFGAAFGAGFIPHFNVTSLNDSMKAVVPQQSIGFNPYIKAEGSFFRSTCIRLRLMYTMGNVELMSTGAKIPVYNDGAFKVTNNSQFVVSLLFIPFANRWHESAWYNDYDSYNWNEKLN